MRGRRIQRGFSLIELLIATSLAAGAAALLAGGLLAANRIADLRMERAVLTQLLANRLAELDDPLPIDESASGSFSSPYDGYTWALERLNSTKESIGVFTLRVTHEGHTVDAVTARRMAAQP